MPELTEDQLKEFQTRIVVTERTKAAMHLAVQRAKEHKDEDVYIKALEMIGDNLDFIIVCLFAPKPVAPQEPEKKADDDKSDT